MKGVDPAQNTSHTLSEQTKWSKTSLDLLNFKLGVQNSIVEIEMWFWKPLG